MTYYETTTRPSHQPEPSRQRARLYSQALQELRDRHKDEFEEIFAEKMGRPRRYQGGRPLTEMPFLNTQRRVVLDELVRHKQGLGPARLSAILNIPHSTVELKLKKLAEGDWAEIGVGPATDEDHPRTKWHAVPTQKALSNSNEMSST